MGFIKTCTAILAISLLGACGSENDSEPSFNSENLPGLYRFTTNYGGVYSIRFNSNNTGYVFKPDSFFDPSQESENIGSPFNWSIEDNGKINVTYAGNTKQERLTLTSGRSNLGQLRFELDNNLDGIFEYFEDNISIEKVELSTDFEPVLQFEVGNYSLAIQDNLINYTFTNDIYSQNPNFKLGARNGEYMLWTILDDDTENKLSNRLMIISKDPENGETTIEEFLTGTNYNNSQIEYALNIVNDTNLDHSIEFISSVLTWDKQPNPTENLSGLFHLVADDSAYSLSFNDDNSGFLFYNDKLFDESFVDFGERYTWTEENDGYIHILYDSGTMQQKLVITREPSSELKVLLLEDTGLNDDYDSIKNNISLYKQEPNDFVEIFTPLTSIETGIYTLETKHGSIEYNLSNQFLDPSLPYKIGTRNGEAIYWVIYSQEFLSPESIIDYSHLVGRLMIIRSYSYDVDGHPPFEFISKVDDESNANSVQLIGMYHGSEVEDDQGIYYQRQNSYISNNASWTKNVE